MNEQTDFQNRLEVSYSLFAQCLNSVDCEFDNFLKGLHLTTDQVSDSDAMEIRVMHHILAANLD